MKNQAHLAFKKEQGRLENGNWIVPEKATCVLYDGRYCAVSGFVYAIVGGKYSVLANVRGPGCPDFRGFWNCPCGYLERDEDSVVGILREIKEECGIIIPYTKIKILDTETDPATCNKGNVTIRHKAFLGWCPENMEFGQNGGEKDEVTQVRWIPLKEVKNYSWAFGHDKLIFRYAHPWLIRKWYELIETLGKY